MTTGILWKLLLKTMGIWVIMICIGNIISYFIQLFSMYSSWESNYLYLYVIVLIALNTGLIFLVIHYYMVRTDFIIEKLNLNHGFDEEKIDINISEQTFIALVISIIGGIKFIEALPVEFKDVFTVFQDEHIFRE